MTPTKAILCALAAFFGWVLVDAIIKFNALAAMSPFMIIGITGVVGTVSLVALAACRRDFSVLRPIDWRGQAIVAAFSLIVNYANAISLKHLPLTVFYIVVFTIPLIIACGSALLKHEALTRTRIACLIAGFIGVVIAVGVRSGGGDWIGYAAATASVLSFSGYAITIRKISQTESAASIQFVNASVLAIAGLAGSLPLAEMPGGGAAALMAVGGLGNLLGNLLYNKALKHAHASTVSQFHYTQIIWGALVGYLIWHEVPTWNLVAGSVLIVASGMVVAAQARKEGMGRPA